MQTKTQIGKNTQFTNTKEDKKMHESYKITRCTARAEVNCTTLVKQRESVATSKLASCLHSNLIH